MTRLGRGVQRHVGAWVGGLVEDAAPDAALDDRGTPVGILDAAENFVATEVGTLEVRGGTSTVRAFTTDGATAVSRLTAIWPFSPIGMLVCGEHTPTSKVYVWQLDTDGAFYTGVEATSRLDLGWTTTTARPMIRELWEVAFIVDANPAYASRQPMVAISAAFGLASPTYDLDADVGTPSAGIRAYCAEVFNGVLFVAGYDSELSGEAPEMVRHSMLGVAPAGAGGFDPDAYAKFGAVGQPVTAMRSGTLAMLVAKEAELYRVTGFGRSLPGWQYQIQTIDNTKGVGCANPFALEYAEGHWYGLGEAGPFRTDGQTVELLVGARRRTWAGVDLKERAFVAYHPQRRVVLFGVHTVPVAPGRSATYPSRLLVWDIDRECWQPDWTPGLDLSVVCAVPTETPGAPTAAPTSLAFVTGTQSSVDKTWSNAGDSDSRTEVWLRADGGVSTIWSTELPGAVSATSTGLAHSTKYFSRVRHIRGVLTSDFTAEVAMYTALKPPVVTAVGKGAAFGRVKVYVECEVTGANLSIRRDGAEIASVTGSTTQLYEFFDTTVPCGASHTYDCVLTHPSWPVAMQTVTSATDTAVACANELDPYGG